MDEDLKTERFVAAVRDRRGAMYRTALSYLKNVSDAEDAVSEAIEATWSHLDLIRRDDAVPAYLMTAVINASRGTLRKKKREIASEDESVFDQPDNQETPLWEYVGQLPEMFRVPILMRYGEGIPEQEIAKILHLRRGTVSSRLARGLQQLREQMKEENAQ